MACAHVQPATVKAHAPDCVQVSNIRLRPSPREDIGATQQLKSGGASQIGGWMSLSRRRKSAFGLEPLAGSAGSWCAPSRPRKSGRSPRAI